MLKLSEKEKKFIADNLGILPGEATKVNDILDSLDDWITENGFDEDWNLTDRGRRAQQMYDNIYANNP